MSRGAPWLVCALLVGCADPDVVCDFSDDGFGPDTSVEERELRRSGTVVLPPGQSRERRRFRITVGGLSELGTSHARWGASFVRAAGSPAYGPGVPDGAELPPVVMHLSSVLPGDDGTASPVPEVARSRTAAEVDIFACNGSPASGCCQLGEPECENVVELLIARDDTLFPEVEVRWEATFHAEFPRCEGESGLRLEVDEVTP